jgi:hypothetical protein
MPLSRTKSNKGLRLPRREKKGTRKRREKIRPTKSKLRKRNSSSYLYQRYRHAILSLEAK